MGSTHVSAENSLRRVVGSPGNSLELSELEKSDVAKSCEILEIRLDLMASAAAFRPWQQLAGFPLLFTARRGDEGGAGDLSADVRADLLRGVAAEAAWIDIEVASIAELSGVIDELGARGVPWIGSFHDFEKLPETVVLTAAAERARAAGATIFKAAARLDSPADMARLAEFQLADHGIPVATMGMGPLAPVSRLLCAQCGSVLNYGYLGTSPTAPGQWEAGTLRRAIDQLVPFPS